MSGKLTFFLKEGPTYTVTLSEVKEHHVDLIFKGLALGKNQYLKDFDDKWVWISAGNVSHVEYVKEDQ